MAAPIVNELLSFSVFYYNRVTKSELCSCLANFYHEDELQSAKAALCNVANSANSNIDGWSRLVNAKGAPILHKGDGATKRSMDADDIVSMLAVLDANSVSLPVYAAVDQGRVPPPLTPALAASTAPSVALMGDLAKSVESIVLRLEALEARQVSSPPPSNVSEPAMSVLGDLSKGIDAILRRLDALEGRQSSTSSSLTLPQEEDRTMDELASAPVSTVVANAMPVEVRSWAQTAAEDNGNLSEFTTVRRRKQKLRVGQYRAQDCQVKAVPRPLACFVGRLDAATQEDELHAHLVACGMKGVVCKKLKPKPGHVFSTAAFKVTCCVESRVLFYNEANWPCGAELRDWYF